MPVRLGESARVILFDKRGTVRARCPPSLLPNKSPNQCRAGKLGLGGRREHRRRTRSIADVGSLLGTWPTLELPTKKIVSA